MRAELLAPAGSYESLEAALAAGADAVYLGGTRFGARAYADNLDEEQMCRAIDLVHIQDKKLYLTVNTLLKQREIDDDLYQYMLPYYREGLDGVIVQDPGVISALHSWFPGLPVHGSTQMAITGAASASLLKEEGLTRVVPARELSLNEIREIYDRTGLEIECFIHGALCYSYSGMCLMSSMIGGRSGNRGRCAGTCRLPYEVYEGGRKINGRNTAYPLNTKDMCTLEILPEIIDAGVCSFKIEGRMKKPEYTAGVVRTYRKYLDLLEEKPESYRVEKQDLDFLYDLFNRDGFHQSYYKVRNGRSMMALKNVKLTEAGQKNSNQLYEQIRRDWKNASLQRKVQGELDLHIGSPAQLILSCGSVRTEIQKEGIQPAQKQPLSKERVTQQMNKTGQSAFAFEKLDIRMDENLFLPMQVLNELRREGMDLLEQRILDHFRRDDPDQNHSEKTDIPTDETISEEPGRSSDENMSETPGRPSDEKMPEKSGNTAGRPELWALVETEEQFRSILNTDNLTGIGIPIRFLDRKDPLGSARKLFDYMKKRNLRIRICLPYMVREQEDAWYRESLPDLIRLGAEAFLVRCPESAARLRAQELEKYCILDYCMYTMNRQAQEYYRKYGFTKTTVPLELNSGEISARENADSELVIYGRTPMMISAQCLKKNLNRCTRAYAELALRDRKGMTFPVRCYCDSCYNVIYNSVPTSLFRDRERIMEFGCCSLRIHFTTEGGREAAEIAGQAVRMFVNGEKCSGNVLSDTTRGHFKRGVE